MSNLLRQGEKMNKKTRKAKILKPKKIVLEIPIDTFNQLVSCKQTLKGLGIKTNEKQILQALLIIGWLTATKEIQNFSAFVPSSMSGSKVLDF